MKYIRQCVFSKKIWVSIDETTNDEEKYIENVIIGTLEEDDSAGEIFLLNTDAIKKKPTTVAYSNYLKNCSVYYSIMELNTTIYYYFYQIVLTKPFKYTISTVKITTDKK